MPQSGGFGKVGLHRVGQWQARLVRALQHLPEVAVARPIVQATFELHWRPVGGHGALDEGGGGVNLPRLGRERGQDGRIWSGWMLHMRV